MNVYKVPHLLFPNKKNKTKKKISYLEEILYL